MSRGNSRILEQLDNSVFGQSFARNEESSSDEEDDLNQSDWIPSAVEAEEAKEVKEADKTKLVELPRRNKWIDAKPELVRDPQTTGIEISMCYKFVRIKLQFSRDPYEHGHVMVIPYTNLKSIEYTATMLSPDLQTRFQKDMKKGELEVTSSIVVENQGRSHEKHPPMLFTRVPEWGMDYDREMLYMCVQKSLQKCAAHNFKKVCFPSMIVKDAPIDDTTEIVLEAMINFIEAAKENPPESVVLRVCEKTQFRLYADMLRSKMQQLAAVKS